MAIQLLILRNVPDDEADEIRELLKTRAIDYYETPAGNWGISMPAIWLNNEHQFEEARALIDNYQQARFSKAREQYEQLKRDKKQRTIVDEIRENPIRLLVYLAIAGIILYFSTYPFINWGGK
jgi:hypothetical protein